MNWTIAGRNDEYSMWVRKDDNGKFIWMATTPYNGTPVEPYGTSGSDTRGRAITEWRKYKGADLNFDGIYRYSMFTPEEINMYKDGWDRG